MSWWIWFLIVVVALSFFRKKRKPSNKKVIGKKNPPSNIKAESLTSNKSAKDIANGIITIAHFRALEKKIDRAEEKANDALGEKASERAHAAVEMLREAFEIASTKILQWQFIPSVDLDTPLDIVKSAYKVFPAAKYQEKLRQLGNDKNHWIELRGHDEPEDKDEEIKFILKFRTIVENTELSVEETSKKINALVSRNAEQAIDYFDIESNTTPAEQWRIDSLK